MDPIAHLVIACAAFMLVHVFPSTPLRAAASRTLGEGRYLGAFSAVTLAAIVWMVYAYNNAPVTQLWPGLRHLPAAVMPFAFILIATGVLTPNPTAVGAGRLFERAEPALGIIRITRHPVMWGIMLWAAAHLLARGTLKSTLFFGTFLLLGAAGTWLQDARKAKIHGDDWKRFAASTSNVPFIAIVRGRNRLAIGEIGMMRVVLGLMAFGGVFMLHGWLIGLRPY